jgi:hypothetical protein
MPQYKYDYKATSESVSFAENFIHAAYAID